MIIGFSELTLCNKPMPLHGNWKVDPRNRENASWSQLVNINEPSRSAKNYDCCKRNQGAIKMESKNTCGKARRHPCDILCWEQFLRRNRPGWIQRGFNPKWNEFKDRRYLIFTTTINITSRSSTKTNNQTGGVIRTNCELKEYHTNEQSHSWWSRICGHKCSAVE